MCTTLRTCTHTINGVQGSSKWAPDFANVLRVLLWVFRVRLRAHARIDVRVFRVLINYFIYPRQMRYLSPGAGLGIGSNERTTKVNTCVRSPNVYASLRARARPRSMTSSQPTDASRIHVFVVVAACGLICTPRSPPKTFCMQVLCVCVCVLIYEAVAVFCCMCV